jgi:hypothetical protein
VQSDYFSCSRITFVPVYINYIDLFFRKILHFKVEPGWLSRYSDGLRVGRPGVRFPAEARDFSLLCHVQTGCGIHPASCPYGAGDYFFGGKAAWALN